MTDGTVSTTYDYGVRTVSLPLTRCTASEPYDLAARDELLLALADYVLETYQPMRSEKAERIRELREKVMA